MDTKPTDQKPLFPGHLLALPALLLVLATLAGCGEGAAAPAAPAAQASGATQAVSLLVQLPAGSAEAATALPSFHAAPVLLDEPTGASGEVAQPHQQVVPAEFSGLSTRRLTVPVLREARRTGGARTELTAAALDDAPAVQPFATGSVVTTYAPAQVRAAYGLPALPAVGAAVSSSQAAQLGAGQTIYVIDAQHDPNAAAELAAFNSKFALPGCATVAIDPAASLPLAPGPATGCTFSIVYTTTTGARTATAPAYDSGWATEIALDVQWAHAIAPYARIVLIEAPDASVNSLVAAVQLANAMGPGAVSMSFGAGEGSWTSSYDGAFAGAGMNYFAAAGDSGAAAEWPAVSSLVVAVGGTSLTWSGTGTRSEVAWSGTGGGVSAYVARPSWQSVNVPGVGATPRRAVSDVAFNADPGTGQYVAVQSQGSTTVQWMSAGGTSLATPQWAALVAIANAQRASAGRARLADPHAALYGALAAGAASYAASFGDVQSGSDGTCASCVAAAGYDLPTGLGTPNATALVVLLAGGTSAPAAPVVAGGTVAGTSGAALSFSAAVQSSNPISYSLAGAPTGMAVATSGTVSWATPLAGTYNVVVTALDTATGLSGRGTYVVTISAPVAPTVTSGTANGTAGTPLSFTATSSGTNPVTWSISGNPSGMAISSAGVASWASPVAGSWSVVVSARDTKTGLVGQGTWAVKIAAPAPPTVGSGTASGVVARALSFTVPVTSTNGVTWTVAGAPTGLSISSAGQVNWASPVAGTYTLTVSATDTKTGLTGKGSWTVTIAPAGPVITASALNGVAGKLLTGTIRLSDATSTTLNVSISGIPAGMSLALSGTTINVSWTPPVAGKWTLAVTARDGNGLAASLNVPVTISAQ